MGSTPGRSDGHVAGVEAEDARGDVRLGLLDVEPAREPDRVALLSLLRARGFTDVELVAAAAEDRLFGLLGDTVVRGGPRTLSVAAAAERLSCDSAFILLMWAALGLQPLPDEGPALTEREADGLLALCAAAALLGRDQTIALARVAGIGLARLAEAEATTMRSSLADVDRGLTGSETVTALAWETVASQVPGIGTLLDIAHRRHLEAARGHFEGTDVEPGGNTLSFGVGFADMSGFTALSATLDPRELSALLSDFESRAAAAVQAGGGRVVKFMGDAVMFVTARPEQLAVLALALAGDSWAVAGVTVRVGIAYGQGIAHEGDYFGDPVNLAARLVAAAAPGEVLAAPSLATSLAAAGVVGVLTPARALRGFAEPVAPLSISR